MATTSNAIALTFIAYAMIANITYLGKTVFIADADGLLAGLLTMWMPFLYAHRCAFLSMWHLDVSKGPVAWAMFAFIMLGGSIESYACIKGTTTITWFMLNIVYLTIIMLRMIYSAPVRYTEYVPEIGMANVVYLVAVVGAIVPVSISTSGEIITTDSYVFLLWVYIMISRKRVEASNIELLAAVTLFAAVIMNLFLYTYLDRVGANDALPEFISIDILSRIRNIMEYVCLGLYDLCVATSVITAYLRK